MFAAVACVVTLAVVATASAQEAAHDGPFGLYIGEPIAKLGQVTRISPSMLWVMQPPKTNAAFKLYSVVAYPSTGVCSILAFSDPFVGDPDGDNVIAAVDQLSESLNAKYGQYNKKVDECSAGNDVCSNNWTTAFLGQLARYAYAWDFGDTPRADRIWRIADTVSANFDTHQLMASVVYLGANHDACAAAEKALNSSSL